MQQKMARENTIHYSNDCKPKVLLVINDGNIRRHLQQLLCTHYHCSMANKGNGALALSVAQLPDLIVSGDSLAFAEGGEITNELKNNPLTCHIPIIFLTSEANQKYQLNRLKQQVDHYLRIPFDDTELCLKVRNLLLLRDNIRNDWAVKVRTLNIDDDRSGDVSALGVKQQHFINSYMQNIQKHYQNSQLKLFSTVQHSPQLSCNDLITQHQG